MSNYYGLWVCEGGGGRKDNVRTREPRRALKSHPKVGREREKGLQRQRGRRSSLAATETCFPGIERSRVWRRRGLTRITRPAGVAQVTRGGIWLAMQLASWRGGAGEIGRPLESKGRLPSVRRTGLPVNLEKCALCVAGTVTRWHRALHLPGSGRPGSGRHRRCPGWCSPKRHRRCPGWRCTPTVP